MTAIFLLQICFVSTCSHTLLIDHQRHLNTYRAVVARRTNHAHSSAAWRQRHSRRASTASPSHSLPSRRRAYTTPNCQSPREEFRTYFAPAGMRSTHEIRRRSSVVESPPADPTATTKTTAFTPQPSLSQMVKSSETRIETLVGEMETPEATTPPPPTPSTQERLCRASRSTSSASRNTNRLSLTLPIAPPTSDPSRPASVTTASYPPTPADTSALTSPADPNDFIIAIAAQERRVLEIREELARAEAELARLKRDWTAQGARKKRELPVRPLAPQFEPSLLDDDEAASRRSVELDRRKALLRDLQGQTGPREYRRRVLRGGHTRTLSLLSPTKPEGFVVHEDNSGARSAGLRSPVMTPSRATLLSKRASWQPRTYNTPVAGPGVKQIAQDFRQGLWSFMEDIRQATVGDEPIHGLQGRPGWAEVHGKRDRPLAGDQDTIKALNSSRPRVPLSSAFESPVDTPSKPAKPLQDRPNPKPAVKSTTTKAKRFSWTPLTFDSLDDNDWSNWESPSVSSAKPARWSGSTIGGAEEIASMSESNDENGTPLSKNKSSISVDTSVRSTSRPESVLLSPTRLEELLPIVNKLSPGNLKRTANNLMDEWEKSLSPPQNQQDQEQLIDFKETSTA